MPIKRRDPIDVSREALAAVSGIFATDVDHAVANAIADPVQRPAMRDALKKMDMLISDMDALVGTDEAFLAFSKYAALLLVPPPIPPTPGNFTPSGYKLQEGGYWKNGGMSHGAGHDIATCATECNAAKTRCVAFELSATNACYMFSSMTGGFIKNPGCKTFVKRHSRSLSMIIGPVLVAQTGAN